MKKTGVLLVIVFLLFALYRIAGLQSVIKKDAIVLAETTHFILTLNEILIETQAGHLISSANALSLALRLNGFTHTKDKEDISVIKNYESNEVLLTLKKMRTPLSMYDNFPKDDFDKNVELLTKNFQECDDEAAIHKLYEIASEVERFIQENKIDEEIIPKGKSSSASSTALVASNK
jgi:hypothetical protein